MKKFVKYNIEIEFEGKSRIESVASESFSVGRSSDCAIHIESKNLSRQHMKINLIDQKIYVEDLKSTNGCYLEGVQLMPGKPVLYTSGQRLTLGKHEDVSLKIYIEFELDHVQQSAPDLNTNSSNTNRASEFNLEIEKNVSVKEIKQELKEVFNKDPLSLDDPPPRKAEKDYKEIMNQVEILKTEIVARAEKRADKILDDAKIEAEKILLESKSKAENVTLQAQLSADKMLAEAIEKTNNIKEQSQLADVLKHIEEKNAELEKINGVISTCRDNLKSLELKNAEFIELEGKYTALEISLKNLDLKKQNFIENQKNIEENIELSSKELDKINKEKEYIKTLVMDSENKNKLLTSENSSIEIEIQKNTEKKLKLESEVFDIESKRKEFDLLNSKYNDLEKNIESKNDLLKGILTEIQNVNTDLKALKELQLGLVSENTKQKVLIDLENTNLAKLKNEFEDLSKQKNNLNLDISNLETTKKTSNAELSDLQEKLIVLEKECSKKITSANNESELIISQAKAKAQAEYMSLMQKSKQDLIDKENVYLSQAKKQAQEILDKAGSELKRAETESKRIMDETSQKAESKAEKILKESQQRGDDLRDRAQAEYQRLLKEAEAESDKIKARTVELMDDKKKDFVEFEKKRIRKSAELLKSELNVLLYSKLKLYLKEDSEDYTARVKSSLEAAVNSSMLNEVLDSDAEMYALLDDKVKKQQQKNINYWRYTVPGTIGLLLVVYFSVPILTKQFKEQSRKVASVSKQESQKRIKQMEEKSKEALFEYFDPKKSKEFKDTYTDRVLYTIGYADLSLEKEYREDWILELETFFTDKLKLNENALVPFISQEVNLIKELVEQSKKINGKFVDQGIARMREIEEEFVIKLKENLKSEKDYKKVIEFQKKFYNERAKNL